MSHVYFCCIYTDVTFKLLYVGLRKTIRQKLSWQKVVTPPNLNYTV